MKVKSIYRDSRVYMKGKNPLNDVHIHVFEVDGKYYKETVVLNHSYRKRSIEEISEEETKNIPEERKEVVGDFKYELIHGNNEERNIKLGEFHVDECDSPEINKIIKEEEKAYAKERIEEVFDRYPETDFREIEFSEKEQEFVDLIMDKIVDEVSDIDLKVAPVFYKDIFSNMEKIVKGKAFIIAHRVKAGQFPDDEIVTAESLKNGSIQYIKENEYYSHNFEVVEPVKETELPDNEAYLGSCWLEIATDEYPVDIIRKADGEVVVYQLCDMEYMDDYAKAIVDLNLPFDRYNVNDGTKREFERYNEVVNEEKGIYTPKIISENVNCSKQEITEVLNEIVDISVKSFDSNSKDEEVR